METSFHKFKGIPVLCRAFLGIIFSERHENLRFLEIPARADHTRLSRGFACKLAKRGEHPKESKYVAVPYCWDSFKEPESDTNNRSFRPSPTVKVEENGAPRDPKCPADVLIRAISFAIVHDVSLIWIYQECVDQTDPIDVENHLQCNHVIFCQAKFKVGLLSFKITDQKQVHGLIHIRLAHALSNGHSNVLSSWGVDGILADVRYVTRLLRAISRDRWFTRTWVFQERYSANIDMCLMLPASNDVLNNYQPSFGYDPIGTDFPVSVEEISFVAIVWRHHFTDPELDQQLEVDIAMKDSMHESLSSLHDAAQLISGPIFMGAPLDIVWDFRQMSNGSTAELVHVRNYAVYRTFLGIENCDNRVFSDRLTILSNLMDFEWRLPKTHSYGYSFALVLLVVQNEYYPTILVRGNKSEQQFFSSPVSAVDLIINAFNLKKLIAQGDKGSECGLDNMFCALADISADIQEKINRHENFEDVLNELGEDRVASLFDLILEHIHRVSIVPLSSTIVELLGGIVGAEHIDDIGLDHSHGEAIVRYGVATNQHAEGDAFLAFNGRYRWRCRFVEKFF